MSKASKTRWRQRRREDRYIYKMFCKRIEAYYAYRRCLDVATNEAGELLLKLPDACKDDTAKEKPYNSSEV